MKTFFQIIAVIALCGVSFLAGKESLSFTVMGISNNKRYSCDCQCTDYAEVNRATRAFRELVK